MADFEAIGLVVRDLARSLDFYRLLGVEVSGGAADGHVEADLPGGIRLMFDTVDVVRSFSEWEAPTGGHRIALAFRCADADEVDDLHHRLVEAGHQSHVAPFDAPWGMRYATVLDPDGNAVDLFADLPAA